MNDNIKVNTAINFENIFEIIYLVPLINLDDVVTQATDVFMTISAGVVEVDVEKTSLAPLIKVNRVV
jgi:hypothetical protein